MDGALMVSVGGADALPWGNNVVEQLLAESEELLNGLDYGDPTPSYPPNKTVRPKRSRNSTRDRQQSELQFLRRHVSELTEELHRLAQRSSVPSGERASALRTGAVVSAWQRVSQRQHQARTRSEQENYSLHSQVVQRAKLLRGIQELLQLHRRHTVASPIAMATLQTTSGIDDDVALCALLKQDAANVFARTEAMLSEQADPNQIGILSMTQRVDLAQSQLVARLQTTRVFPFDVHATTTALWRALPSVFTTHSDTTTIDCTATMSSNSGILGRECEVRLVERSDSVYAVSYSVPLTVGGTTLVVRVRDVVTRYDCDTSRKSSAHSKSVFIWQTALESHSSSLSTHGVHVPPIRGCGWLVLDQDPHACRSSVLQSVFEFRTPTPTLTADTPRSDAMDAWVSLGEACMDNVVLQVDKRLLA